MKKPKKIYMPIPQPDVYYGITVDKKTKLEYENESVKQRIEDLVLYTEQNIETDSFKTHVETELYLNDGDLLLLEEDGRGYFKPAEIKFGSVDEALKELRFIKKQILKVKE